jgi:hypothetical protein
MKKIISFRIIILLVHVCFIFITPKAEIIANPVMSFGAEVCDTSLVAIEPTTDGGTLCVNVSNQNNKSEVGDCDPKGASVWVKVKTDSIATLMKISFNNKNFRHIVSVYYGDSCSNLQLLFQCYSNDTITVGAVFNRNYWIKVEAEDGLNLGSFDFCVNTFFNTFDCTHASYSINRPEYPTAPSNGPFYPNEIVNICIDIVFTVAAAVPPDGNNCQWLQGIIPTLKNGWDYTGSNLPSQGPAGASWFDDDLVDYNFYSPIYSIIEIEGRKGLAYKAGGEKLKSGSLLPGGWYFISNGGGTNCQNDGDPDNMWGLPSSCNATQNIIFCLDLKIKDYAQLSDCEIRDLELNIKVTTDGETGCWDDASCGLDAPLIFKGEIDCSALNLSFTEQNIEVCSGGKAAIAAMAGNPSSSIQLSTIDNPNVIGETLEGEFQNGVVSFTDNLINTGSNIEIVKYIFKAKLNGSLVYGPSFELIVKVYPQIKISFPTASICEGDCVDIVPVVGGGTGSFSSYLWDNNVINDSLKACPLVNTNYFLTVTDTKGCTGSGATEIMVLPTVKASLLPNYFLLYQDSIDDIGPLIIANINVGKPPFDFQWVAEEGIIGFIGTTNYKDDTYDIDSKNSMVTSTTKKLCVIIADSLGCDSKFCSDISILSQPNHTNELLKKYQFSIFPNPANNTVTFSMELPILELVEVVLINALGQEVIKRDYQKISGTQKLPLDISMIPNGIYNVVLKIGAKEIDQKLLIMK